MIIFVSQKLSSFLGKDIVNDRYTGSESGFRDLWNGTFFYEDRRKCILLTNKSTLFSIVLLNVVKKDVLRIHELIFESLVNQLKAEGLFTDEEGNRLEKVIERTDFFRTDNDRKVIGSMNDFVHQIKVGVEYGSTLLHKDDSISFGTYLNTIPMSLIGYSSPRQKYLEMQKQG